MPGTDLPLMFQISHHSLSEASVDITEVYGLSFEKVCVTFTTQLLGHIAFALVRFMATVLFIVPYQEFDMVADPQKTYTECIGQGYTTS